MLAGVSGRAQEEEFCVPDSLMMRLKENENENAARAEVLCEVLFYFNKHHNVKNCYDYIIDLSEISTKIGSLYYKAVSDYYMGGYYCELERYADAMMCFNRGLKSLETLKNSSKKQELKSRLFLAKSYCLMLLNMYNDSYTQLQNGFKITNDNPDLLKIHVGLLTNESALLYNMGKSNESFVIMKDAIAKCKMTTASPYNLYYNISVYYNDCGLYNEAIKYCDSSQIFCRNEDDRINSLIHRGDIYVNMHCFEDAEKYYMDVIGNKDELSNINLTNLYKGMSNVKFQMKDYNSSLDYINYALSIACEKHFLKEELICFNRKIEILRFLKRHEEAFDVFDQFNMLNDSVNRISDIEQIELNKAQQEVRLMEDRLIVEKEASKIRQRNILIISASLFVIVIVILLSVYSEKKSKEKYLSDELNLRNREITSKSMSQIQNNELLTEIIEKLERHESNPKGSDNIRTIIKDLQKMLNDGTKKDFDYYFVQVHPEFYEKLLADFPKLTQNELRLCAYIKANLNIKDVANLTNVSSESVKSARKRLRRQLGIVGDDISIVEFLSKY